MQCVYIRVVRVAVCQRNKERIFALFGTHRIYTINTVKRFSRAYKMPFITSGMAVNHSGQDLGYELYMRPLYAQALYDIIVMKGWQKIMYVYDSLEGENDCVASCNTTDIDMRTCRPRVLCHVHQQVCDVQPHPCNVNASWYA